MLMSYLALTFFALAFLWMTQAVESSKETRAFLASIVWAIGFVVSVLFTLTCMFGGLIQFIELGNIWLGLDCFLLMAAGPVIYFSVEFVAKKIRGDQFAKLATIREERKNA